MRLGWLVALAASVALMVGALVTHTSIERERRSDRDDALGAVSALSAAHVDAELARVATVLRASADTSTVAQIATVLGNDINVCVIEPTGETCSTQGPRGDSDLLQRTTTAAGQTTSAVFATGTGDATDGVVVVAIGGSRRVLIAHMAARPLLTVDTSLIPNRPFNSPRLVDHSVARVEIGPSTRGGRRVFTVPVSTTFVDGERYVVASTPGTTTGGSGQRWALVVSLVLGGIVFAAAVGALVAQHRRLSQHAATDDLTGLLTRREFERLGGHVLASAGREHMSAVMIFIDLNGFKQVNDHSGHHVGDIVLKAVAAHLSGLVRDSDVIARWGGDEFAMLLPGAGSVAAGRRAAEIEAALEHVTTVAGRPISASVGAAVFPDHGGDLAALTRAADSAMYAAKRAGLSFGLATGY